MTTSMSIHKLRIKAKEDRGQACLQYMQTRTSPVTLKDLAGKLGVTTKAVSNSLIPLIDQGKVQRELMLRQSVICNKLGWAYGYYATERKDKVKKTKTPKFQYHNPFNLGARP
jgi:predicted ArsR family transcriptional regulator